MAGVIEKAKSGRAKCRKCREKIEKDELRFGHETDGEFGQALQWYHLKCAAIKVPLDLEKELQTFDGTVPDRAALDTAIAENRKKQKPTKMPYAEMAPSGRSSCLVCGDKIPKDEIRVAIEREIDTGEFTRMGAGYLHPQCTAKYEDVPDDLAEQIAANSTSLDDAQITAVQALLD